MGMPIGILEMTIMIEKLKSIVARKTAVFTKYVAVIRNNRVSVRYVI